jgi:hypothetical protein
MGKSIPKLIPFYVGSNIYNQFGERLVTMGAMQCVDKGCPF